MKWNCGMSRERKKKTFFKMRTRNFTRPVKKREKKKARKERMKRLKTHKRNK
jgi:exonuclease I